MTPTSTTEIVRTLQSCMAGKVQLLIVDDDKRICQCLKDMLFISPIFNVTCISTFDDAVKTIAAGSRKWHCWVLDYMLGSVNTGVELIDKFPHFGYTIFLSAAKSMQAATQVIHKGAHAAFDKDPEVLFESDMFYRHVCFLSAVSYLLGGTRTDAFAVFELLWSHNILTIDEWAQSACKTTRQLRNICNENTGMPPGQALLLYHTLYYLLLNGGLKHKSVKSLPVFPEYAPQAFFEEALSQSAELLHR